MTYLRTPGERGLLYVRLLAACEFSGCRREPYVRLQWRGVDLVLCYVHGLRLYRRGAR